MGEWGKRRGAVPARLDSKATQENESCQEPTLLTVFGAPRSRKKEQDLLK